jgi:DNA-binding NarL/FixJ family response regulator
MGVSVVGNKLRVLICDQALLIRDGLRTLLDPEPDIDIVDTTDSGLHAIMIARTHKPHVVITGLVLRSIGGIELIRRLAKEDLDPVPRFIAFVTEESNAVLGDVLYAGADGVLTRDTNRDELARTVRVVAQGQAMLAPSATQVLLEWLRQRGNRPEELLRPIVATLTPREHQVLRLTARGLSTEELAAELAIGVATVRTHLYRLRCKLQLQDRAQLVAFAFRAGLMQSADPPRIDGDNRARWVNRHAHHGLRPTASDAPSTGSRAARSR